MQQLTQTGEKALHDLAQRYGVSLDAVSTLLSAVSAGGGSMAQFYHSELGGGGQWMRGGMTMVGDMFNSGLQARVSGLCAELSTLLSAVQVFAPSPVMDNSFASTSNNWWPAELGSPSSSGSQNNSRYAYFPSPRRLVIETGGHLEIFDTLDHQIGGVQQQQGGPWGSLSFSSQFGTFTVDSLPRANGSASQQGSAAPAPPPVSPAPVAQSYASNSGNDATGGTQSSSDVLAAIERLGLLFNQGVLSNDEFLSKKAELLSRL